MSEQTTNQKTAEQLTAGDHITDDDGVAEVAHVLRYRDGNGRERFAVTLNPLYRHGDPWTARHSADDLLSLATADEIREAADEATRHAVAMALHNLADDIIDGRLPVATSWIDFRMVLDSRADVDRWAKHLGTEARMGGTDKDIPIASVERPVVDGLTLDIHVQGPAEPAVDPSDDQIAAEIDAAFADETAGA